MPAELRQVDELGAVHGEDRHRRAEYGRRQAGPGREWRNVSSACHCPGSYGFYETYTSCKTYLSALALRGRAKASPPAAERHGSNGSQPQTAAGPGTFSASMTTLSRPASARVSGPSTGGSPSASPAGPAPRRGAPHRYVRCLPRPLVLIGQRVVPRFQHRIAEQLPFLVPGQAPAALAQRAVTASRIGLGPPHLVRRPRASAWRTVARLPRLLPLARGQRLRGRPG